MFLSSTHKYKTRITVCEYDKHFNSIFMGANYNKKVYARETD
jgi:hypothetical protein